MLRDKIARLKDPDFDHVWNFMQASDHFYYMATKWLSDGDVHAYFNPYESSYDAFINLYERAFGFRDRSGEGVRPEAAGPQDQTVAEEKGFRSGESRGAIIFRSKKAVRHNRQTASLLSVSRLDHVRRYTLFAVNLDVCSYIPERGCAKFLNLTHPFGNESFLKLVSQGFAAA